MRLAANTDSGFPVILSLWFLAKEGELFAVVHRDARIVKRLRANSRCAFEVSVNEVPYRGVRGQAVASIESQGAGALLQRSADLAHRGQFSGASDGTVTADYLLDQ